jgi:O-antigen/teichoic acid export membrane protein
LSDAATISAPATVNRQLGKNALIYGLGMILSRAASFIMLPVYTHLLTPDDYGILNLLQLTQDIVVILLAAGVANGVLRFYFKADTQDERNGVVVTAFVMTAVLNGIGALILLVGAPWIGEVALNGASTAPLIRIAAITFALEACTGLPMTLMQAQQKPTLFTMVSTARLVMQLSLNILFLVVLGMGVQGILLSSLITAVCGGSFLVVWMFRQTGFRVDRTVARNLTLFGLPYKFVTLGTFILTYVDRFFLKALHGLSAVGVYSLAYQFGFMLFSLGPMPFMRAWGPQRFEMARREKAERDRFYNDGLRMLSLLTVTLAVGISLFVGPVLMVMSDEAFHGAAVIVPIILAAYLTQAWTDVVELGIQVSEKTKYATYATWTSVAVIVVLYATLIPVFGAMGAALATLISFVVRFFGFYYWSQRVWPVAYEWGPSLRLLGFGTAVVVADQVLSGTTFLSQAVPGVLLLAAYAAMVWLGALRPEDRLVVRAFAGARVRRLQLALVRLRVA